MKCFNLDLFSPPTKSSDSCVVLLVSKTFLPKGGMCVVRVDQDSSFLRVQALVESFINHRGIGFVGVSNCKGSVTLLLKI